MIRRANEKDIDRILKLLSEVLELHAAIRPDIFKPHTTKYNAFELKEIINSPKSPIYVYTDKSDEVVAYSFCVVEETNSQNQLKSKTLFIDDFCVDEEYRGKGIGKELFDYVVGVAKDMGCAFITLNVWEGNDAQIFYEKMGMRARCTKMELKI